MQVQGFATATEAKRPVTSGVCLIAEVLVFGQDKVPLRRDRRARRNLVPRQIVGAVAQKPAADVNRLVGGVVKLDPVGDPSGGIGQKLVDDDRPGSRNQAGVIEAG